MMLNPIFKNFNNNNKNYKIYQNNRKIKMIKI